MTRMEMETRLCDTIILCVVGLSIDVFLYCYLYEPG